MELFYKYHVRNFKKKKKIYIYYKTFISLILNRTKLSGFFFFFFSYTHPLYLNRNQNCVSVVLFILHCFYNNPAGWPELIIKNPIKSEMILKTPNKKKCLIFVFLFCLSFCSIMFVFGIMTIFYIYIFFINV